MSGRDFLAEILARKRVENQRRSRRANVIRALLSQPVEPRGERAIAALRRGDGGVRFITEIKHASPSAGRIRERAPGSVGSIARAYERAGASAISVLADAPGFGGTPLDVRRVAAEVSVPVLFKEFVLHELQVELARAVGASMVLLLVRALPFAELEQMIRAVRAHGMEPVVEAADDAELAIALRTDARIVGINARDLRTFAVDPEKAAQAIEAVGADRVSVFMSGIRQRSDVLRIERTRADAVLVGEGLMRAADPGAKLRELRGVE